MNTEDEPQAVYTGADHQSTMDDLIVAGALGLIGLYLAAVIVLFAVFSFVRLMYHSFVAGDAVVIFLGVFGVLIVLSLYMAIGFCVQKTDRI